MQIQHDQRLTLLDEPKAIGFEFAVENVDCFGPRIAVAVTPREAALRLLVHHQLRIRLDGNFQENPRPGGVEEAQLDLWVFIAVAGLECPRNRPAGFDEFTRGSRGLTRPVAVRRPSHFGQDHDAQKVAQLNRAESGVGF